MSPAGDRSERTGKEIFIPPRTTPAYTQTRGYRMSTGSLRRRRRGNYSMLSALMLFMLSGFGALSIDISLLHGQIDTIAGRPFGTLTIAIPDATLRAAIDELARQGLHTEVLGYVA